MRFIVAIKSVCVIAVGLKGAVPVITEKMPPPEVEIPATFQDNPIDFFDDFSWRSFIAMVWPAKANERGVPDPAQTVATSGVPLVFETYKAEWEVFQPNPASLPDGVAPSPWNSYAGANPAGRNSINFGEFVLAQFSKFGVIAQTSEEFHRFAGPIIAMNNTYIRYATAYNRLAFDDIVAKRLYLASSLGTPAKPVVFSNAAITVKSAWMDMQGVKNPGRFYVRKAIAVNLETGVAEERDFGLIGLHIVQKTPNRPQWVWSTFEHVDNVPPGRGEDLSLHDGSKTAMPGTNPIQFPPPPVPAPQDRFNITRDKDHPIHPRTVETNNLYRAELAKVNSVWQNYQLVMTQWPRTIPPATPADPKKPGTPPTTFPGSPISTLAVSAFANTTLETFDQTTVFRGCMACHNNTRFESDFVFSIVNHAWAPSPPAPPGGKMIAAPIGNVARNDRQRLEAKSIQKPTLSAQSLPMLRLAELFRQQEEDLASAPMTDARSKPVEPK